MWKGNSSECSSAHWTSAAWKGCCTCYPLHPTSASFHWNEKEKNKNINKISMGNVHPLSTYSCYNLQITCADVKWIWDMHILNLELESKNSYIPISHPWPTHLNSLPQSQTRAKFTQFQRDNPKESQVAAPGTLAVLSYRDHVKIEGYSQNPLQIKNQFMEVKKIGAQ